MPTILITSMGGAGSNNLVDTIRLFDTKGEYRVIGTHFDPYELVKSDLKDLYIVPRASDVENYIEAHLSIIEKHQVEVLIVNSDKEVTSFSSYLNRLPCKHLIPDQKIVKSVQDKYMLYKILSKHGCSVVPNVAVSSRDDLENAFLSLPKGDKYWIRLRGGSGSLGATWLFNYEQALKWIDLWSELRGFRPQDFVLAPFLPGRDFCVALLFQDGDFAVGKIYERLRYLTGGISISNMGSTPSASRTVRESKPIEACIQAIQAVYREHGGEPHGYFQFDIKCDEEGTPYVTEINIGRFPMTSPQFDRVGRYNLLELYLQMILEPERKLPRGEFDFDPGIVMLRSVDFPVKFVSQSDVDSMTKRKV
ncbi:MAG: hypothetical protein JRJ77_13705 [Deltaproteobacteria bacterium]|nr:hypothetical protein [Deltaproteobacteria bacterium]